MKNLCDFLCELRTFAFRSFKSKGLFSTTDLNGFNGWNGFFFKGRKGSRSDFPNNQ